MKSEPDYKTMYPELMEKNDEAFHKEKNRDRYEYRDYRILKDASFVSNTKKA